MILPVMCKTCGQTVGAGKAVFQNKNTQDVLCFGCFAWLREEGFGLPTGFSPRPVESVAHDLFEKELVDAERVFAAACALDKPLERAKDGSWSEC